ncbi:RusA family crossover junction endodeoxyribonuclease [Azorhizobium caulinodans]|uniref:RusA family crossover junction endodeoxyribonuclease n=1 Tax=Azorhizobium caulinodans TaxID=7 RepID=UPI002FBD8DDB
MPEISVDLPFPPSVNAAWRSVKGRVLLSKKYRQWLDEAEGRFLEQGAHKLPRVSGAFEASIVLDAGKRRTSDVDNRIKPVLDALQRFGLVANDRHCDRLTIAWGDAPAGCSITILTEDR